MKKFLLTALAAVMLWSFGAPSEAEQIDREQIDRQEICCGGYCEEYCDEPTGEYCGRGGCRR